MTDNITPPTERYIAAKLTFGLHRNKVSLPVGDSSDSARRTLKDSLRSNAFLQRRWAALRRFSEKGGVIGSLSRRCMNSVKKSVARRDENRTVKAVRKAVKQAMHDESPKRRGIRERLSGLRLLRWLWAIFRMPVAVRNQGNALQTQQGALNGIEAILASHAETLQQQSNALATQTAFLQSLLDGQGFHTELLQSHSQTLANLLSSNIRNRTAISTGGVTCIQYNEGLLLGLPSGDWRLSMYLSLGGYFEYGTERFFQSILKPDMIVVDVGANVGIFTMYALRAGCEVYAFEPTPNTFEILQQNAALNGFEGSSKAVYYNAAVSDHTGTVQFAEVKYVCGHNSMFPENEHDIMRIVPCTSLDEALKDVPRVDIVKIDVEGAEPFVLRGMRDIVEKNPHVRILLEIAPANLKRAGVQVDELLTIVQEYGFSVQLIDESSGNLRSVTRDQLRNAASVNVLLTRNGPQ